MTDELVEKIAKIIDEETITTGKDYSPLAGAFPQTTELIGSSEDLAGDIFQAILSDPSIVELSADERGHIMSTQQNLCDIVKKSKDDGSCALCKTIQDKLSGD